MISGIDTDVSLFEQSRMNNPRKCYCVYCGKEIIRKDNYQLSIYCSDICRYNFSKISKHQTITEKKCRICGSIFTPSKNAFKVYYCNNCRWPDGKPKYKLKCYECGIEYYGKYPLQKTCSEECFIKRKTKQNAKRSDRSRKNYILNYDKLIPHGTQLGHIAECGFDLMAAIYGWECYIPKMNTKGVDRIIIRNRNSGAETVQIKTLGYHKYNGKDKLVTRLYKHEYGYVYQYADLLAIVDVKQMRFWIIPTKEIDKKTFTASKRWDKYMHSILDNTDTECNDKERKPPVGGVVSAD